VKAIRCLFLVVLLAPMFGCGLVRDGVGLEEYKAEDGTTKVRSTSSDLLDKGTGLLGLLGPWGIAAGAAIGVAKRVIRHREILAHGQNDDDFDGTPDDEQTKSQGTV
jgi:hypothetical protein